jgi:uncharacterized Zn finger protein
MMMMDGYEQRKATIVDTDHEFIKALRKGNVLIACRVCGQVCVSRIRRG